MSDIEEGSAGELTIRIDRLLCVGFGDCIEIAPEGFEFDEEGIAVLRESVDEVDRERLLEACDSCPVDALVVLDAEGEQLVP